MASGHDHSALVERVANHTLERDMESETWQKAVAINGLLEVGGYDEEAKRLVDRSIATQTTAGQFSYGSLDPKSWTDDVEYKSQTDPAALGYPALEFYDRTGDETYLDAARRQYEYLAEQAQRTAEGGIGHHRGKMELWVDAIYMLCPFLARYGAVADEPAAFDDAARQVIVQTKYLQDPHTDLYRHEWREQPNVYPEDTFWSRGNGWVAAGILDALEYLPESHEKRDRLVEIFRSLCKAVRPLQDASGFWHNILDDDQSALETSGTLMFAYAFQKGIERGYLDEETYGQAARDGMDVSMGVVRENGEVGRVVGPPGGPGVPFAVTSYGQGWFLLAAAQHE
ncbi:glycoside hydrolase family 88 protein [Halopenitus sp. H-Gu1]|uniref:glycoside hydrolase family 88 protein n=1 Tax=Halopenitus sp. H-Gu1 TaxID=3242697 RepID=UPI00359E4192